MLTHTVIWTVDEQTDSAKVTVFERRNAGQTRAVAGMAIDLEMFDTREKVNAEAENFAREVRLKRIAEAETTTEDRIRIRTRRAQELQRVAPITPISIQ